MEAKKHLRFTRARPVCRPRFAIVLCEGKSGSANSFVIGVIFLLISLIGDSQNTRLWATYYGGTETDYGSVATDVAGNVYLAGNTTSPTGIASGGFQNTIGGVFWNVFLVKFNAAGSRIWATYYGGTGGQLGYSVATDAGGNVYLAGSTSSVSGIASGGFQNTYGGNTDAFLVKFNAAGTRLWATYYGGIGQDIGKSVATDNAGNIYLAGFTGSPSGIASGGFQNTSGGSADAFLVKFNPSGNRLWATYYGGTGVEDGYSVATDTFGNVYLGGATQSTANIASGGFQNTYGGGMLDAFLVKFNATGTRLWATYYGGLGDENDLFGGLATDATGNVYLGGYTRSTAGIASGGFQNAFGGGVGDAFLVKFNAAGTRLWATYYGELGKDYAKSVVADVAGNVYMGGETYSTAGIASGGFQNILMGTENGFVVKFNASGIRLCATYYGQGHEEEDGYVAVDGLGNVYLAGQTQSFTGIASGGFQNTHGGGFWDAYLVKFTSCFNNILNVTATATNLACNGQCIGTATVTPTSGTSPYTYAWSNAQTTQVITGLCAGTYSVLVTDAGGTTATAAVIITQPTLLTATATVTNASCGSNNGSATVNAGGGTPGYTYSWNSSPVQTTQTATGLVAGNYTATVTDANGCTQTATVTVTSNSTFTVNTSSTQTGCTTTIGTASATPSGGTPAYTYNWSNGQTTQTAIGLGAGTYTVTITDVNGCTQTQTVSVTQTPGPIVTAATAPISITFGASTTLSATGGGAYSWSPSTGLSCTTCQNPVATPSVTTVYCVTVTDANNCTNTACVTVVVDIDCSNAGELYLPNAFSPNGDGENDKLQIYYGNLKCIKTFKLVIYNRWREKVFETTNPIAEWDGFYKGKLLNTAVFVYYMKATLISGEEIIKKGNISLMR